MYDAKIANETSIEKFHRKSIEHADVIAYMKEYGQYDRILSDMRQQKRYDEVFQANEAGDMELADKLCAEYHAGK